LTTGDPILDFALSLRSGLLTPVMKGVSDVNSEYAYLAILPLIYWLFSIVLELIQARIERFYGRAHAR